MNIVLIEFDYSRFTTALACQQWLRTSAWKDLEKRKDFKLKQVPSSLLISQEKRKVYQWKNNPWMYHAFRVERPENNIYILYADSDPYFTLTDLPPLSAQFIKKQQELHLKQEAKDKSQENRRLALIDNRRRREEEKRRKKSGSVVESMEERIERKLKKLEESKKRKREERKAKAKETKAKSASALVKEDRVKKSKRKKIEKEPEKEKEKAKESDLSDTDAYSTPSDVEVARHFPTDKEKAKEKEAEKEKEKEKDKESGSDDIMASKE